MSWRRPDLDSAETEPAMDGLSSRGVGFGVGPGGSCPTYDYEIEHSQVETWLDEHPEFFKVGVLNIIIFLWFELATN